MKKTVLLFVVSLGIIINIYASENDLNKAPFVLTDGLDTMLPCGQTIAQYLIDPKHACNADIFRPSKDNNNSVDRVTRDLERAADKVFDAKKELAWAMDNKSPNVYDGSERAAQIRSAMYAHNRAVEKFNKNKEVKKLKSNNGVVCTVVRPGRTDLIAIVVDTKDCGYCEKVQRLFE